ncbi:hypothetical protein B7G68_05270 [Caulobacter segnis]|uniref:Lipoprotein n=2 Tax=Caulobacter segnis TaxID=88688 RepID=D5VIF8_CAUST|nr:hypothetical protein [Caulobacter segnis]ADG09532.1 conserved hypothetical protein [Caulobacter segnis ATCC 21756]AVQ01319.1 hypothetical protein B7G68_05270 [Caulobacter segnis]
MKRTVLALTVLAVALAGCGRADPNKPENGMMTGLRAIFAFKACTSELERRFGLKEIEGVNSDDMDPQPTGRPGEWDVRFTADVTEKGSGRVTRYKGVCHVRRDKPTTLDAAFVKEVHAGDGVVRRLTP